MRKKRLVFSFAVVSIILSFTKVYCETAEEHIDKGIIQQSIGDIDGAFSEFNKAIQINPDLYQAYNFRGLVYGMKGKENLDIAISDFNKAIKINPRYASAYFSRGIAYKHKGDLDKAISDFSKAIEIDSYFIDAYNYRAGAYFEQGMYEKAWDDVHKIETLGKKANLQFIEKLKKASGKEQ